MNHRADESMTGRYPALGLFLHVAVSALAVVRVASVFPIWVVDYIGTSPPDLSPYGTLWAIVPDMLGAARTGHLWFMCTTYWFHTLVLGLAALIVGGLLGCVLWRVRRRLPVR